MTITIPKLHRPILDGLETDEEQWKAAMAEYEILKETNSEDKLDFSNKTAMWIAYERDVESNRPQNERLFNDPLAKYFIEPYGKRLSDCMAMGMKIGVFDPPGANIGLGMEGHVMYTAARTKLINNHIDRWLAVLGSNKSDEGSSSRSDKRQVVNLGVGVDTRVYWLESLKYATAYYEIDTKSVMEYKQQRLDELKQKDLLPEPLCTRKVVSMDFAKESLADSFSSSNDFSVDIPTCWVLEGLIMYLPRENVIQLMNELSALSCSTSLLILNFSINVPSGPTIDEIDDLLQLQQNGWKKNQRLMFGEDEFNFGRYPDDKPPNNLVGFAIYTKL